MLEFDETFSNTYLGKEAITRRIKTRILHTTSDIPYFSRGLDVAEFTYGSQLAAIKLAFRDLGPGIEYDGENSRIQYYDISVEIPESTGV
jgi:hypothetical protein